LGKFVKLRWSRTAIATALTAVCVVVPCTAWYLAGSRATRQQASRLEDSPRQQAHQEATRLAQQVALRLEAMRQAESRRPFLDYLSDERFEQLLEDCTYDATLRSPLAEGPVDPLIWAHFQIDDVGVITMPTLHHGSWLQQPSGTDIVSEGPIQEAILSELECASSEHLAALRRTSGGGAPRQLPTPQGLVTVGPFSWHTVAIEDAPALVALREVATPSAVLTQGFVVPGERIRSLLEGALFPADAHPGDPVDVAEVAIPIQGDRWSVAVDASKAFATAAEEANRMESRFLIMFVLGAFSALIAGSVVVLLVHETERTARERARFAASAAHELRTPLASLQLYGEMLAEGSGDPARYATYGRRVAQESDRLGRVVSNVLGYSKLQRDGLAVNPRPGDLEPPVRSSIDRLRPTLESAGASIEVQVDRDVPRAVFDPDALHQILQNLIDNAVKFCRDAEDRTIHLTVTGRDGQPTIEVRDHGHGVAHSIRRKLFQAFTHHPDPDSPAGLGIGLALVRALADAQGAEVTYDDAPGGGAIFTVRLGPAS
jgi:signal transduction histidine kinase